MKNHRDIFVNELFIPTKLSQNENAAPIIAFIPCTCFRQNIFLISPVFSFATP